MDKQEEIQQLLAQMHGIALPDNIAWWSFSSIVWLASAIIILAVIAVTYAIVRHKQKRRIRKLALAELRAIHRNDSLSAQQKFKAVNALIKRCIYSYLPSARKTTGALYGVQWYRFLFESLPTNKQNGSLYDHAQFMRWQNAALSISDKPEIAFESFQTFAKQWINSSHKKLFSAIELPSPAGETQSC
jgi:hypothetical protein